MAILMFFIHTTQRNKRLLDSRIAVTVSKHKSLPKGGFEIAGCICHVTGLEVMKTPTLSVRSLDVCREAGGERGDGHREKLD